MDRGGRGSHRCAGACAPVPSPDLQRYKAASLLERRRCPDPNGIYEPYRCTSHRSRGLRGPPERSVMHDRGKRRGSARWRPRCEAIVHRAEDAADVNRSATRPCHASAAARNACGPALLPAEATVETGAARSLAPTAVCARIRVRETPTVASPPARGRACVDAVAQTSRRTPRPPPTQ